MVLRTLRGVLKVILIIGNQGVTAMTWYGILSFKMWAIFLSVFPLLAFPKLHSYSWHDLEVWKSLSQQLSTFLSCLLAPVKISQTPFISIQDIPSTSRQPLGTNFCHFTLPFFSHTSFLSYKLDLQMIFYSFHSSLSQSTLKHPPLLTSPLHLRHPTHTASSLPVLQ